MIIKVLEKLIELDLKFIDSFKPAHKYEAKGDAIYHIISSYGDSIIENKKLINETKYYDNYILDDGTRYVIHKNLDGKIIGTINYKDKYIFITLIDKTYQSEYVLSQYGMVYIISNENALLMHGSSLIYKNKGIIFTAPSGTGKSTHSRLWQKYADVTVVNDDKNILYLKNDKIYLYPCPWSGKHHLDNNVISTLDTIIFLYQNKENVIEELKPMAAFKLLLSQLEAPSIDNKDRWNKIVDKLLELPILRLGCNMEEEAFKISSKKVEEILCL